MPFVKRLNFRPLKLVGIASTYALLFALTARAENFTNALAAAVLAEKHGDLPAALVLYGHAERLSSNNAMNLCTLSRCYCELTYLTNSLPIQKTLLEKALACALQAIKADPLHADAHACAAVCYAKSCPFYDLKTKLAYSRLFKVEAEKTIALDPRQDIAYYLLGRWNYALANVGWMSRAYVKVVYGELPEASNEAAIKNFQEASRLAPNRIINYQGLALAYAAMGQTNFEQEALQKCCDLKPVDREDMDAQREAKVEMRNLHQ